jgi:hypothetical protein
VSLVRKFFAVGFISTYLAALSAGLACHAMGAWTTSHPVMYYFVWDMFCGWSAYDSRMHIVAEGESQTFYRLTPAPWGEFQPFGSLGREHYDSFNGHGVNIGMNVLKHTQHEPMVRLFVIEESWAKKYNLPDAVWKTRYDGSKDRLSYYRVRSVTLPDSQETERYDSWHSYQAGRTFADNPRLQSDSQMNRPLFVREPPRVKGGRQNLGVAIPQALNNVGSASAN